MNKLSIGVEGENVELGSLGEVFRSLSSVVKNNGSGAFATIKATTRGFDVFRLYIMGNIMIYCLLNQKF